MTFGEYVRAGRLRAGMTLREASKLIGISHVFLGEVETGRRGSFARDRWERVAEVLGLDVSEMTRLHWLGKGAPAEALREQNPNLEPNLERDLEVWRQAYNASLTGLWSEPQAECPTKVGEVAVQIADQALADYRAKREVS